MTTGNQRLAGSYAQRLAAVEKERAESAQAQAEAKERARQLRDEAMAQAMDRAGKAPGEKHRAREADVAERIADGNQIRLEHWPLLAYDEKKQLLAVNPDRYRKLAAGRDPDSAWVPGA